MNGELRIATLNSAGGDSKTLHIVDTVNRNKLNVLFLQEIHNMSKSNIEIIERDTKTKCFMNPGTQRGRGVITLVDETCINNSSVCAQDTNGNFLHISADYSGTIINLMNLYAPSRSAARRKIFEETNDRIRQLSNVFLAGDFNCIESYNLDATNKSYQTYIRTKPERDQLEALRKNLGYIDSFRQQHPTKTAYTYTGIANYRARLDRIYVPCHYTTAIGSAETVPTSFSDHDLYILTLKIGNTATHITWGKGLWKYNKRILEDKKNLEELKRVWENHREQKWTYENMGQYWEKAKQLAKKTLMDMGRQMKRKEDSEEKTINKDLRTEHSKVTGNSMKIRNLKTRLKQIEDTRIQGAAVRSKMDWQMMGEQPTKYFFNLEKSKMNSRPIEKLIDEDGKVLTTKQDILEYTESFFRKRFSKGNVDKPSKGKIISKVDRVLTDEQNKPLNVAFTIKELEKSVKNMKNGKSPGGDGLTPEFYRQTWSFIAQDLLDTINYIFLSTQIPLSMTQGVITLVFKNKGERERLRNWRPICLLNTDYKAMTRIIAARFEPLLPLLISPDQFCGISGRHIEDALINIQDIYDYCKQFRRKCAIYALDFEGAYDYCDHDYMIEVLKKLNVGPRMVQLSETIFRNMYTAVTVNGARTSYFRLTRSCRQGDPASLVYFLLAQEPLSNLLKHDHTLHPINIPNQRPKLINSYADDNTVITSKAEDYRSIKANVEMFCAGSGAKINDQKTEILLIGPWTDRETKFFPQPNIKRNIKLLGVWFGPEAEELNRKHILDKIDNSTDQWKDMSLSMQGKLLIINTKILSQFYHIVRITGMSRKLREEIQKRLNSFTWYPRKMCLVAYRTLENNTDFGGLNFPKIENINYAILAERIAKILNSDREWKGHMVFRMGVFLRELDPTFMSDSYIKTQVQTPVTNAIMTAYRKLETKVQDWSSENFKTLKAKLHENTRIERLQHRDLRDTWRAIQQIGDRKARDTAYLTAHGSLTVADVLIRRGMKIDDKCRLCRRERETTKHIFVECTLVQRLKSELESRMTSTGVRTLTEEELIYYEGLLKWRKKIRMVAAYTHAIWRTRGLLYYGHINGHSEIKNKMMELFSTKLK